MSETNNIDKRVAKEITAKDMTNLFNSLQESKPKHWLLLSPNGDLFRGDPDQLLRMLIQESRFMKWSL